MLRLVGERYLVEKDLVDLHRMIVRTTGELQWLGRRRRWWWAETQTSDG